MNFKGYIIYGTMKLRVGFICAKFMLDSPRSAPALAFGTLRFITLSLGRHKASGGGGVRKGSAPNRPMDIGNQHAVSPSSQNDS